MFALHDSLYMKDAFVRVDVCQNYVLVCGIHAAEQGSSTLKDSGPTHRAPSKHSPRMGTDGARHMV